MGTSTDFSVNQKGSVLPIILIVLLAGVGVFIGLKIINPGASKLVSQASTVISGNKPKPILQMSQEKPSVKTYQDYKLNFKFEYPVSGFEVISDSEESYFNISKTDHRKNFAGYVGYQPPVFVKGLILKGSGVKIASQYDSIPLVLWIFDNPNKLSIDSWFDKYWYYPFIWGIFAQPGKGHIYPVNEATISGQLAKSVTVSYQPGKPEFIYIANQDKQSSSSNKMFMFRVIKNVDEKVVTQILSSFKFTK